MNGSEIVLVVVGKFDVVSRSEDLAIFQPDEVRFWDSLSLAGEHCAAPYCFRD